MLLFTKNNTKTNLVNVTINKTFCDSSSRTDTLKRNALLKEIANRNYNHKNTKDVNGVNHKIHTMRNSGGIPKKCNL